MTDKIDKAKNAAAINKSVLTIKINDDLINSINKY